LITAISSDILDEVEFNITFSGKDMGKNVKSPIYLTYGTSGQLNDYNRYIADITYSFYNGEGHTGTA
jgi:hypothetical protein